MAPYVMPEGTNDVHVAGWTIVRVGGRLDAATAPGALAEHVGALLTQDAHVVIDLRHGEGDPLDLSPTIRSLADQAAAAGAELVVVAVDEAARTALRRGGVPAVYESLDAALHVATPVLREAEAAAAPAPVAPGADDALRP